MLVEHMTWVEYGKQVGRRILVLPVGSIEQHGPHLPLNTDVVIPKGLAVMASERIGGMVLPPILYGYKSQPASGGGQAFPGTTSLDAATLIGLTFDILRESHRHGAHRFMILNGHYENVAFLTEAIDLFQREVGYESRVVIINWWDLVSGELLEELFAQAGFPGWEMEHAAIAETSLVMYFEPDLVRTEKIQDDQSKRVPNYAVFPPPEDIVPKSGVLYKATQASREKGKKLAEHIVEAAVAIAEQELGGKGQSIGGG